MTWPTVMPTDSDMAGHSLDRGTLKSNETWDTDAYAGGGFSKNKNKESSTKEWNYTNTISQALMVGQLVGDDRNLNLLCVGIGSLF